MKGQEGYTGAEALAALAILGLAMAGLTTSMRLITMGQAKARDQIEQSVRERAVDQRLELVLARTAPFRSDESQHLVGDELGFEMDCGDGVRCRAKFDSGVFVLTETSGQETRLRLPAGENPRFIYVGSYASTSRWPPQFRPPPAPAWQSLTAVMIHSGPREDPTPLAVAKIWRQQRADCEFDVVIQDCRKQLS